jgi:ribosomal protein S18 acetylase RimI-like enzyme
MDFTIEELSINAWPALKTLLYDGWIIRLSNGYGNRANSINPIYPSKRKLEEKLAYCDELFSHHNLSTNYKLIGFESFKPCEEQATLDKKLEELDYVIIHETSIQTCEILEPKERKREGIIVSGDFDNIWIESAIAYSRIEEKYAPTFKAMLGNIAVQKIVVRKEVNGVTAACAYGAIENGYVGIFDVVVKEELRGKGFGREIVDTVLYEASKLGVKNTYLQVMMNNLAALHLYESMGYKEIYRYWYRKKA